MTFDARTPDVRALASAVAIGGLAGLAVGAAYLAGGLAHSAVFHPAAPPSSSAAPNGLHTAIPPQAGLAPPPPPSPIGLVGALRNRFQFAFSGATPAPPFRSQDGAGASRDTDCLAKAVYYEARGEPTSGQAAVAQVVLNRVRHPDFPKTVCGVVFQRAGAGCQFSFACNGAMHGVLDRSAWRRAMTVAERAVGGAVMGEVGDATEFQAAHAGGWAAGLLKVAQVGAHVFYRVVGHGGGASAARSRSLASAAVATTVNADLAKPPFAADPAPAIATTSPAPGVALIAQAAEPKAAPAEASAERQLTLATAQP